MSDTPLSSGFLGYRDDDGPAAPLPKYKSHKEVWALKIAAIEFGPTGQAKIVPVDKTYAALVVDSYRHKFTGDEKDLGYYVRYADGYESWSPTKAFEDGYTLVK